MNLSPLPTITQDAQEPRWIRRSSLALLLAVMALPTLPSCGQRAHAEDASESAAQTEDPSSPEAEGEKSASAERVRVEAVVQETIERSLEAVANVQSLDVVDVLPERAEPVLEILAEEGQRVKEGQVLARLRDRVARLAYQEAEVRVTEAQNEVSRAKRDAARNRQLADRPDGTSLLSERDMENSEQALLVAQTALESAKVRLDQAKLDLDRCTLRAPIDGTLTMRDISVGDQTLVGQRAFQVADLDHPRVIFYRPQAEFSLLSPGQELTATAEAFPGVEIRGKVERVAPVVDPSTSTVRLTLLLTGSFEHARVGGFVKVRITTDSHTDALAIPKLALVEEGGLRSVFVAEADSVRKTEINTGLYDETHVEVLDGLTPGDYVVTLGQGGLRTGTSVDVLNADAVQYVSPAAATDQPGDETVAVAEADR